MELCEWAQKNESARQYAHFDLKVSLKNVWSYISNPNNVVKHGFYPFIQYERKYIKYSKKGKKEKTRKLCYSAHIDRYIYSYYGYLLNQKYNKYMAKRNIDMVSVAYRDNLRKNNIHFAKHAFDFIKETDKCMIIIGDFSDFFDSLDHVYLKQRMCELIEKERLPADYYAIFKNITQYSTWNLIDLLKLNGLKDTVKDRKILNSKNRVLSKGDFKRYVKEYSIKNKEICGIPQGSAISAVLANIYMIKIDEEINELITQYNGLYMRYSDDFIIVLPEKTEEGLENILFEIQEKIKVAKLTLQEDKTKKYRYENYTVKNCNGCKNEIDYLGFSFDGENITIRDKTISKYYYRLYRKIKTIEKRQGYTIKGKRISCKNLYEHYSIKGAYLKGENGRVKGNFLTYVKRAQKIFGEQESINSKTKRHMLKIRRKLDKVFKKI